MQNVYAPVHRKHQGHPSLDRARQIAVILRTSIDHLVGLDNQYTLKFPDMSKEQRNALNLFLQVFVDEQIQEK